MTAQRCPDCGTERDADGGSGCGCALRAGTNAGADAVTGGFDPLRIRPYVAQPEAGPYGDGPRTAPIATAVGVTTDHGAGATPEDLGLFAHPAPGENGPQRVDSPRGRQRSRKRPLAAVVGATVAVVAVCGGLLAAGLLGGDDERDQARPNDLAGGPTATAPTGDATEGPTPSGSASRATAKASASASPSPGKGTDARTSASPSASGAHPASARTPVRVDASSGVSTPPGATGRTAPPSDNTAATLKQGMRGSDVLEMQQRLNEEGGWLLAPDVVREDGHYSGEDRHAVADFQRDNGIEGDASGVYGPNTRRALEAMTSEP
ncbi:peptidoglycan-binding domain-containing protein [Streptomyces syringium]|uniref:peptidoglycan-binding domain-containing protein n=1 Tax=Streptomyces syringium TaxID=76729 RepID=UPI0033B29C44